eukprot:TRINITY_DN2778_c0_g1_i10.p1 TRINITY_DN2778_c0_g1~~TRINITY_DN2778_c0_g1_i10.p1  ORF type:complete len:278 (-),score=16.40 TRINITY_DN2778_c0_g1_i10:11-844(-)
METQRSKRKSPTANQSLEELQFFQTPTLPAPPATIEVAQTQEQIRAMIDASIAASVDPVRMPQTLTPQAPSTPIEVPQTPEQVRAMIDASIAAYVDPARMLQIWETEVHKVRLAFESKSSWEGKTLSSESTLNALHQTVVYQEKEDNDDAYPRYKSYKFTLGPLPGHQMIEFSSRWNENGDGELHTIKGSYVDRMLFESYHFRMFREPDPVPKQSKTGGKVCAVKSNKVMTDSVKEIWRAVATDLGVPSSVPLSEFVKLMSRLCDESFGENSSVWDE